MNTDVGYLEIVIGPMCSGKTTYLFDKLNTFDVFKKKCLYINHSFDTRGEEYSSHNENLNVNHKIVMKKTDSIIKMYETISEFDVIGIDESQFFGDLVEGVKHIVNDLKKTVFVGGLSGDFERKSFGHVLELIPFADNFKKLEAFCVECMKQHKTTIASFSKRICETQEQIVIGDSSIYIPVCRRCY